MGKVDPKPRPERLLTIAEVAYLLGVTTRTVQNLIAAGVFSRVVKITATDIRIPDAVYDEFVRNRTVNYEAMAA